MRPPRRPQTGQATNTNWLERPVKVPRDGIAAAATTPLPRPPACQFSASPSRYYRAAMRLRQGALFGAQPSFPRAWRELSNSALGVSWRRPRRSFRAPLSLTKQNAGRQSGLLTQELGGNRATGQRRRKTAAGEWIYRKNRTTGAGFPGRDGNLTAVCDFPKASARDALRERSLQSLQFVTSSGVSPRPTSVASAHGAPGSVPTPTGVGRADGSQIRRSRR
jgi:hypothetical protein